MSKESETQPYRNFKEFLDTIIKMPEDLKNRLANEFERRRLEKINAQVEESPVEESPVEESEPEDKSFFGDIFAKNQEDKPVAIEDKPEENDKSFFDSIFTNTQTDEIINKFSEPGKAPQKKCQIRPW